MPQGKGGGRLDPPTGHRVQGHLGRAPQGVSDDVCDEAGADDSEA